MREVVFCALETYSLVGGIQNFNRRVIRVLGACASERNTTAHVILLRDSPQASPQVQGVRFTFAGTSRLSFTREFIRSLRSVDILILDHINLLPLAIVARLFKPQLPILLFVYGDEVWNAPGHRKRRFYEPWLMSCIDIVASISDYTTRKMGLEFRVPRSKFRLFPCAVDPIVAGEMTDSEPSVILTVTRIGSGDREKNVDKVLRAFAILSPQMPHAFYEIVGDGELRGELEALSRELGIAERVRFLGRVDDGALRDAYQRASVFVLPSSKEGFGIVYLEAWQWALPVICSAEGASSEIVSDGVDGFVIDPTDLASLAERMRFLLANPKIARDFGHRGRRKVEDNYLDSAFGERLQCLLSELRASNAGSVAHDPARRG